VKLPVHRTGLPGDEVSFILCPLTPPIRRGQGALAGQGGQLIWGRQAGILEPISLKTSEEKQGRKGGNEMTNEEFYLLEFTGAE